MSITAATAAAAAAAAVLASSIRPAAAVRFKVQYDSVETAPMGRAANSDTYMFLRRFA